MGTATIASGINQTLTASGSLCGATPANPACASGVWSITCTPSNGGALVAVPGGGGRRLLSSRITFTKAIPVGGSVVISTGVGAMYDINTAALVPSFSQYDCDASLVVTDSFGGTSNATTSFTVGGKAKRGGACGGSARSDASHAGRAGRWACGWAGMSMHGCMSQRDGWAGAYMDGWCAGGRVGG